MNIMAMKLFLSEDNIKRHIEHLREERLKFSILEKSIPQLKGKNINDIVRLNIDRNIKDEAISLLWYIKSHESFFNSFSEEHTKCDVILTHYSSMERFLYDVYTEAIERSYGFLYLYIDRQGKPRWIFTDKCDGAFIRYDPILTLDLYEHVYYSDYGFQKKRFLHNALMYLNLSSLDNRS